MSSPVTTNQKIATVYVLGSEMPLRLAAIELVETLERREKPPVSLLRSVVSAFAALPESARALVQQVSMYRHIHAHLVEATGRL